MRDRRPDRSLLALAERGVDAFEAESPDRDRGPRSSVEVSGDGVVDAD